MINYPLPIDTKSERGKNGYNPEKFNDVLYFTTGELGKIIDCAPRTVVKQIDRGKISGFRIPTSEDRRVPRKHVHALFDGNGYEVIGTVSPELIVERTKILLREVLSKENIARLLDVAPRTVDKWTKRAGIDGATLQYEDGKSGNGVRIERTELFSYLERNGFPVETIYDYTNLAHEDAPNKRIIEEDRWLTEKQVIDLFSEQLCDGDREMAEKKFNVQVETGGIVKRENENDPELFCIADIVNYIVRLQQFTIGRMP